MDNWYSLTDKEVMCELGARIRLARIERNLTQQMLSERSGLNRSTIRELENGRSVHLVSLLQLMRTMELLERLDLFLPGDSQSPVLAKMKKERKRVKPSRKDK
jgi:transcriptional regulator with XRE-family HTH domain